MPGGFDGAMIRFDAGAESVEARALAGIVDALVQQREEIVLLVLVAAAAFTYLQFFRSSPQTVDATLLPQVAQPGPDPASSDEATGAVAATVEPAEKGRQVVLEVSTDGSWEEQTTAEQDAHGRVEFLLPADGLSVGTSYRVSSPEGDGLDAATSATLAGDAWGDPEFSDEFQGDELSADWANRGEDYNPDGLRVCSKGSGDAVAVSDGTLDLSVMLDPERAGEKCKAKNGSGDAIGPFDYRLNGHAWRHRALTPAERRMMTEVPNAGTLSLMLDVDVADLKSGANTVEFTTTNASPPLIPVVLNIDLILE
jgi:hypothetical protein